MVDIQDFMENFYGYKPVDMWTVDKFNDWKEENNHENDWDYPLEEFDVITDNKRELGIKYQAVRFSDGFGGYDYRYCEIPNQNWRI